MKTQLQIGEKFTHEYVELQVCKGGCKGCYFVNTDECVGYVRNCMPEFRKDGKNVNYQLIIKDLK